MKQFFLTLLIVPTILSAQDIKQKLQSASQQLLDSREALVANLSVSVTDDKGIKIFEYQPNKGLSTASTQKIFTAMMALEVLGTDYTWETNVGYTGTILEDQLRGDLIIRSNGDPSLGSWRYSGYKPNDFLARIVDALKEKKISQISGDIFLDDSFFDFQNIPGGWAWNDIGNYYGSGVWGLNWRENQFDIHTLGNKILDFSPKMDAVQWVNDVQVSGDGDQSIIYTAPNSNVGYINGRLPAKKMTISGAMTNPPSVLGAELKSFLESKGIIVKGQIKTASELRISQEKPFNKDNFTSLLDYKSPTLDKIVYWFLKKSVNLYGETLLKTMAMKLKQKSDFETAVYLLKDFWVKKGIAPQMVNFADGSGLSIKNYVSSKAEVQALIWGSKQKWFSLFLEALPVQSNGMRMKSGSMKHTKSFAGYHTSKNGKKYVFSAIINNYQGGDISEALYKVLNVLK